MTLEQASLVAQIVSAVAVIASLIFVGVQLKQRLLRSADLRQKRMRRSTQS